MRFLSLLLTASLSLSTGCVTDVNDVDADETVELEEQEIQDNGLRPSVSILDFGTVAIGSKRTLSVTLTNQGTTTITCSSLGSDHAAVSLSTTWIKFLAPGASITVYVTFSPSNTKVVESSIYASDGTTRYFTLPVRGVGK
jgi:hypothetical protein